MSNQLTAGTEPPPPPPPLADRRASTIEIVVVLTLTVVLWPVVEAMGIGHTPNESGAPRFTDASILGTLAVEAGLAVLLLPWLARRGWTPAKAAGAAPVPLDVARGFVLWFGATLCATIVWSIFAAVQPEAAKALAAEHFSGDATALVVGLASVVNPLFEEFLWLGYIVPALAPRIGLRGACAVSLALRVGVHLYQGVWAFLGVLPVTLCLTWYYGRTRRIWPVVVAHLVLDMLGLAQFVAAHPDAAAR